MEKSVKQVEKNVSASFGYVKKDMLMLNDAFSDLHDKVQHLSLNHATLLDEMRKLRAELVGVSKKKPVKKNNKKIAKVTIAKKDDLSKVEGIGSSIRSLLYKNNITTFTQLSNTSLSKLKDILKKAGPRFVMHNPETWARQARLASKNNWVDLEKLQKELKGGEEKKQIKKEVKIKEPKPVKKVVTETITYQ
jgi:predicted flap endonuclease-1-like 5' DNA nuclease